MPGPNRTTNKNIRADYAARAEVESSPASEPKTVMKTRAQAAQDAVLSGGPPPAARRPTGQFVSSKRHPATRHIK